MAQPPALDRQALQQRLDEDLEVEFSYRDTTPLVEMLSEMPPARQTFILDWVRRIASTHIEIAYQFALHVRSAMERMDEPMIEAWVLRAMDAYDSSGLHPAIKAIQGVDQFVRQGRERASGVLFEEQVGVLLPFLHGLSGRRLKLQQGDALYTDSEVIYLPDVMAHLPDRRDNFLLYKAAVAYHWAQARYGTFHPDLMGYLQGQAAPGKALRCFHALETVRLTARIERQLPGLAREMRHLEKRLQGDARPACWAELTRPLQGPQARAEDSLALVERLLGEPLPPPCCFHGELRPEAVAATLAARLPREKAQLRVALKQIADELHEGHPQQPAGHDRFEIADQEPPQLAEDFKMELQINGKSAPIPDGVKSTLISIIQDLGEVPNDYLVPAGPGEYDLREYSEELLDPEAVWSGAYHEQGAFFYKEWDYRRKHYRKDWCVMREMKIKPVYDGFVEQVMHKYRRLITHLRKTFEAMRDEDRLLKRQVFGDGVDIDAFVEAWADVHTGLEMSDRLFTRMHREERNIAVMFMVDMSGSTQGWVNEAEREALVLLAESLETLGDRYAIYGFTGLSRKRCEVFPIKRFDEPYDTEVKARISGIRPGDYTRMGAAIRHLSWRLGQVEARTKLLITLSDGKPDDYHDAYRSEYGIEDTRQALFEAHRDGIHAFCITIDEKGQDYLPHMYGAANYTVISEVEKLPLKVSDIYKKITS